MTLLNFQKSQNGLNNHKEPENITFIDNFGSPFRDFCLSYDAHFLYFALSGILVSLQ